MDGITFDTSRIELAFAGIVEYSAKSAEAEFRSVCKGIVNIWISITPPASGKGVKESAASFDSSSHLRGFGAIKRDLIGGTGGSAKRAGIFSPLKDSLIDGALESGVYQTDNVRLFTKKSGEVWGTDKTHFRPDAGKSQIRSIHKAYFLDGQMSSAGAKDRTIGRWVFIDRYVVRGSAMDSYLAHMLKKVGWLASSLNPIARLVGARPTRYMKGKTAPNEADFTITPERMHMRFGCLVDWAANAAGGDMARRYQAALDYQANAMFRRLPKMMIAAAKRAGFKTAA